MFTIITSGFIYEVFNLYTGKVHTILKQSKEIEKQIQSNHQIRLCVQIIYEKKIQGFILPRIGIKIQNIKL